MSLSDLSNEELCVMAQQGDGEAADELYRKCYPLLQSLCLRCMRNNISNVDLNDYLHFANTGFCCTLGNFDVTKGVKFTTLLYTTVKNTIMASLTTQIRYNKKTSNTMYLDQPISDSDGDITIKDMIPSDEPDSMEIELENERVSEIKEGVQCVLAFLPDRQRMLVERYYGIGCERMTVMQLSEELKISRQAISDIIRRGLARMRTSVEVFGTVENAANYVYASVICKKFDMSKTILDAYVAQKNIEIKVYGNKKLYPKSIMEQEDFHKFVKDRRRGRQSGRRKAK